MKYLAFLLFLCLSCKPSEENLPKFRVESLHKAGRPVSVSILSLKNRTIFEVRSSLGIGRSKVKLLEGAWPERVVLKLYLSGLEGLTVSGSRLTFKKEDLVVTRGKLKNHHYYDVVLPQKLLKGSKEVFFSWVDFYR